MLNWWKILHFCWEKYRKFIFILDNIDFTINDSLVFAFCFKFKVTFELFLISGTIWVNNRRNWDRNRPCVTSCHWPSYLNIYLRISVQRSEGYNLILGWAHRFYILILAESADRQKNCYLQTICLQIIYLVYMYKQDLALDSLQVRNNQNKSQFCHFSLLYMHCRKIQL